MTVWKTALIIAVSFAGLNAGNGSQLQQFPCPSGTIAGSHLEYESKMALPHAAHCLQPLSVISGIAASVPDEAPRHAEDSLIIRFDNSIGSFDSTCSTDSVDSTALNAKATADLLIDKARKYIGYPYRYGSSGPSSFDCSGFTSYIYKLFGYNLSRSSREQIGDGRPVTDGLGNLQKGDILIFGRRGNPGAEGHAAIFIGLDENGTSASFIHADRHGVRISTMDEPYYAKRYIGARRILPDFIQTCTDSASNSAETALSSSLDNDADMAACNGTDMAACNDSCTFDCPPPPEEEPVKVYHRIRKGDTLYSLARKNSTTVDAICLLNGISPHSILHIGTELRIK